MEKETRRRRGGGERREGEGRIGKGGKKRPCAIFQDLVLSRGCVSSPVQCCKWFEGVKDGEKGEERDGLIWVSCKSMFLLWMPFSG
jgi:hypothetical protein